jgi:hypothetical protein
MREFLSIWGLCISLFAIPAHAECDLAAIDAMLVRAANKQLNDATLDLLQTERTLNDNDREAVGAINFVAGLIYSTTDHLGDLLILRRRMIAQADTAEVDDRLRLNLKVFLNNMDRNVQHVNEMIRYLNNPRAIAQAKHVKERIEDIVQLFSDCRRDTN